MLKRPVLYYTPQSPPCRAVLLTACALNLDLDLSLINLAKGEHLTSEFLKLNPLHTVPVLEDNGVVITDSHVICCYLADNYAADETLYPKDHINRINVNCLLFYNCGHIFPRCLLVIESILFQGAVDISQTKIAYIHKAYEGLEQLLGNSKYLCGEFLTIADLCTLATVSTTELFAPVEDLRFPHVRGWMKRLTLLPYYRKANQHGVDMIRTFITAKLEENKKAKSLL